MIITFIFMASTLFVAYIAYRYAKQKQELDQAVYEKTGIIAHLKDHIKSITSKLETCEYDLQHTKNLVTDLRRNLEEINKSKKPKSSKPKKSNTPVVVNEPKKRKYNKRKF